MSQRGLLNYITKTLDYLLYFIWDHCWHMSTVLLCSIYSVHSTVYHIFSWTECKWVSIWAGKHGWPFETISKLIALSLKCMVVNQNLSVFVLIHEDLTFLERKGVLPAAVWCDILSVLNHIGTACASGIRQTRLWVTHWLRLMTVRAI